MPTSPRRFSSSLVPFVLALVRRSGRDPSALLKKYLHARPADGQGAEVSLDELEGVMEDAARLMKDPLFGLHCALAMPRGGYGLLEFGLRSAPTARQAIEQLATLGPLINPLVRWVLEVDGEEVALVHRPARKGGVGRQGNIFTVARILQIAREMLGPQVAPMRAWFAHPDDGCPDELARFLATQRIAFGRASNGVSFRAADLASPPADADPELNRALELQAKGLLETLQGDDVVERTRDVVAELLPRGAPSLSSVARKLHLGDRTLQRRLSDEGVSFATLVAHVRREQAERLLERTELTVATISERVGYTEPAAFVRAFRSWTKTTPGAFREARDGGA